MHAVPSPRLSVIIPTYNRSGFLPETVASLRKSGYPDLEIIIVDDGSTDDTADVVNAIGDVKYLHQENQGQAAARNFGFTAATGSLLAFVDSDDRWLPDQPTRIAELFRQYPDIDLIFADARMGNPQDGFVSWIEVAGEEAFQRLPGKADSAGFRRLEAIPFLRRMMVRNPVFISAVIMRRELFEKEGGFDPALCGSEDWELWMRMASRHQFGYWPQALAIYTRHDGCVSNDHDSMRAEFCRALECVRRKCGHLGQEEKDLLKKQLVHMLFGHAYAAYDRGDLKLARTRLRELRSEASFGRRETMYWLLSHLPASLVGAMRRTRRALSNEN